MEKSDLSLAQLREILRHMEAGLKLIDLNRDRRLLYIWAEYFMALQIKERHPKWNVDVTGGIRSPDVLCIKNGKKIRIQVKTGKWQRYEFGSNVMYSADASFGKGTQIRNRRFDYLVFIVIDGIEIREILIFSIDELQEIAPRLTWAGNPKTNPCLLSRMESIEDAEKWIKFYNITDSIYKIERDIIEHPEKYVGRWDKIK